MDKDSKSIYERYKPIRYNINEAVIPAAVGLGEFLLASLASIGATTVLIDSVRRAIPLVDSALLSREEEKIKSYFNRINNLDSISNNRKLVSEFTAILSEAKSLPTVGSIVAPLHSSVEAINSTYNSSEITSTEHATNLEDAFFTTVVDVMTNLKPIAAKGSPNLVRDIDELISFTRRFRGRKTIKGNFGRGGGGYGRPPRGPDIFEKFIEYLGLFLDFLFGPRKIAIGIAWFIFALYLIDRSVILLDKTGEKLEQGIDYTIVKGIPRTASDLMRGTGTLTPTPSPTPSPTQKFGIDPYGPNPFTPLTSK